MSYPCVAVRGWFIILLEKLKEGRVMKKIVILAFIAYSGCVMAPPEGDFLPEEGPVNLAPKPGLFDVPVAIRAGDTDNQENTGDDDTTGGNENQPITTLSPRIQNGSAENSPEVPVLSPVVPEPTQQPTLRVGGDGGEAPRVLTKPERTIKQTLESLALSMPDQQPGFWTRLINKLFGGSPFVDAYTNAVNKMQNDCISQMNALLKQSLLTLLDEEQIQKLNALKVDVRTLKAAVDNLNSRSINPTEPGYLRSDFTQIAKNLNATIDAAVQQASFISAVATSKTDILQNLSLKPASKLPDVSFSIVGYRRVNPQIRQKVEAVVMEEVLAQRSIISEQIEAYLKKNVKRNYPTQSGRILSGTRKMISDYMENPSGFNGSVEFKDMVSSMITQSKTMTSYSDIQKTLETDFSMDSIDPFTQLQRAVLEQAEYYWGIEDFSIVGGKQLSDPDYRSTINKAIDSNGGDVKTILNQANIEKPLSDVISSLNNRASKMSLDDLDKEKLSIEIFGQNDPCDKLQLAIIERALERETNATIDQPTPLQQISLSDSTISNLLARAYGMNLTGLMGPTTRAQTLAQSSLSEYKSNVLLTPDAKNENFTLDERTQLFNVIKGLIQNSRNSTFLDLKAQLKSLPEDSTNPSVQLKRMIANNAYEMILQHPELIGMGMTIAKRSAELVASYNKNPDGPLFQKIVEKYSAFNLKHCQSELRKLNAVLTEDVYQDVRIRILQDRIDTLRNAEQNADSGVGSRASSPGLPDTSSV